jgi:hypothetical protein
MQAKLSSAVLALQGSQSHVKGLILCMEIRPTIIPIRLTVLIFGNCVCKLRISNMGALDVKPVPIIRWMLLLTVVAKGW